MFATLFFWGKLSHWSDNFFGKKQKFSWWKLEFFAKSFGKKYCAFNTKKLKKKMMIM
jgi:hypothetical protein